MAVAHQSDHMVMTEADYLAFEEASEIKHEYCRGHVYAMTGGSIRHSAITVNVSTQFNIQLRNTNCIVNSPDARIHIAAKHSYRYPDVMVFCGDPDYVHGRTDTITNPSVIVEVLSPSTALQDRNEKQEEYLHIESLYAYLLISQDTPKVEHFIRSEAGGWMYDIVTDLTDAIALPDIACTLALSEVYQKVKFDSEE